MDGTRFDFDATLAQHGRGLLYAEAVTTLQVNVGKWCNLACNHCHVEAGPKRVERMEAATADRVLALLARAPQVHTLDLTGGAPELNPHFRRLVVEARGLGRRVMDRCNLTILQEPGMEGMAEFLAQNQVHIVASLPCYTDENVARQRGRGVFGRSIEALQTLTALGYGEAGTGLFLDLVYNPGGAFLPPAQASLEARYKQELSAFGIRFNHLLTLTNMPIRRFADSLARAEKAQAYMELLVQNFNLNTVDGLMCRTLISVGWDGQLYDCDFNQMLPLGLHHPRRTIWEVSDLSELTDRKIATDKHCFGCTAGAGSSCSGSLA